MLTALLIVAGVANMSLVQQQNVLYDWLLNHDSTYTDAGWYFDDNQQYYFESVSFWDVNTTAYPTGPLRPEDMRLALDRQGRVYRVAGFDTCEYNDIVETYPLHLDNYRVRQYGRFFLDLQRKYDEYYYHFVTNLQDFLALNRSTMLDSVGYYHPDKIWEQEERKIRDALSGARFTHLEYDCERDVFLVDYYLWIRNLGDLKHHVLQISPTGRCDVIVDETIAEDIGFWSNEW